MSHKKLIGYYIRFDIEEKYCFPKCTMKINFRKKFTPGFHYMTVSHNMIYRLAQQLCCWGIDNIFCAHNNKPYIYLTGEGAVSDVFPENHNGYRKHIWQTLIVLKVNYIHSKFIL